MKIHILNFKSQAALAALLLATTAHAQTTDSSVTLKDAYKDHFIIGAAINRTIATGPSGRGNRTQEEVEKGRHRGL